MSIGGSHINAAAINEGGRVVHQGSVGIVAAASVVATITYHLMVGVALPSSAAFESAVNQKHGFSSQILPANASIQSSPSLDKQGSFSALVSATMLANGFTSDEGHFDCSATINAVPTKKMPGATSMLAAASVAGLSFSYDYSLADLNGVCSSVAEGSLLPFGASNYIHDVSSFMDASANIEIPTGSVSVRINTVGVITESNAVANANYKLRVTPPMMDAGCKFDVFPANHYYSGANISVSAGMLISPLKTSVATAVFISTDSSMSAIGFAEYIGATQAQANASITSAEPYVIHFHGYPVMNAGASVESETNFILAGVADLQPSAIINAQVTVRQSAAANAVAGSIIAAEGYVHVTDAVIFNRPSETRLFERPAEQRTFNRVVS